MKKKVWTVCAVVAAVCVLALLWVTIGQSQLVFDLSLGFAGISVEDVHAYQLITVDPEGRYCKYIQSTMTDNGTPVLAIVSRPKGGWWKVTSTMEAVDGHASMIGIGEWQSRAYYNYPSVMDASDHPTYYIYYGNDARRRIDLEDTDIPHNVAVSVEQQDNEYWIYVVSYSDSADSSFNVYGLLQEGGFIPKS